MVKLRMRSFFRIGSVWKLLLNYSYQLHDNTQTTIPDPLSFSLNFFESEQPSLLTIDYVVQGPH